MKAGDMAVVREGWGYHDVTAMPYGSEFRRATSAFGVRLVERFVPRPGHPWAWRVMVAGSFLVVPEEALVLVS